MPANALGTAYSPFSSARLAQTQPSGAGLRLCRKTR